MEDLLEDAGGCSHPGGLRAVTAREFRCLRCEVRMDLEGVREWVRAAERARDEVYPLLEVDREFGEILLDERQREVYRRRRILYEVQEATRRVAGERPEMILVTYDAAGDRYECRLFYKQAGAVRGLERFSVAARLEDVLEFGSHADPNVRLASEKIGEFHALRLRRAEEGEIAPSRRVFYASEL